MATSDSRSSAELGIMSWTADPRASSYAIRIRADDHARGDYGIYHTIRPGADDTSDGTMDIAAANYVKSPGAYEWIYKAKTAAGWSDYSSWQTIDHGGTASAPPSNTPPTTPPATPPAAPTSGDGIMSWTANPHATSYAVRIRADDHAKGDYGDYHTIRPSADDTRDGTMDIALADYVKTPGDYEWIYKVKTAAGWSDYSSWQTIDHGDAGSGGGSGGGGGGGGGSGGGGAGNSDPSIMVIGDSFTVPSRGFPNALDGVLDGLGYDIDVIAFSRSGDTSAQSLGRLKSYFASSSNEVPDMALIALGINDALQELAPATTRKALDGIIDLFAARDIEVLLTQPDAYYPHRPSSSKGFDAPADQKAFLEVFEELASANRDVSIARDFLDGLDRPANLQSDNFHPNATGTRVMAQNISSELDHLVLDYQANG